MVHVCDVLGTPIKQLLEDEAAMLFSYWHAGATSDCLSSSIKNKSKQPGRGRSLVGILNWGTRTNGIESEIEHYTEKCLL